MKEKEILIPVRFIATIGKSKVSLGGPFGASISIKTKSPIILAYFYLAFKVFCLGLKRICA